MAESTQTAATPVAAATTCRACAGDARHHQALPGRRRQRPHRPRRPTRARSTPCSARTARASRTLMNILYGLARPDEGEILLDGEPVTHRRPVRRHRARHQHGPPALHARPGADGRREHPAGRRDDGQRASSSTAARRSQRIRELGQRFGFEIDPDEQVGRLSVGWQQRVEILKALYREARILVLDEPTAVLTPQETDGDLRRPATPAPTRATASSSSATSCTRCWRSPTGSPSSGAARSSGSGLPAETDEDDLAELMVGREVSARRSIAARAIRATSMLTVEGLYA